MNALTESPSIILDASLEFNQNALDYRCTNDPLSRMHRHGFLSYLETCWACHCGVVLRPDIVWFDLLMEICGLVKDKPEEYRYLFTFSEEKKEIVILTDDTERMPLASLMYSLREFLPTDIGTFLPMFSTTDEAAKYALYCAFADTVSPFYFYGIQLCGIPKVKVEGTSEDWGLLRRAWDKLASLLQVDHGWKIRVDFILYKIANLFTLPDSPDVDFFSRMFKATPCGSGSQQEPDGWYVELFRKQFEVIDHYPDHAAKIDYEHKASKRKFTLHHGILPNGMQDGYLMPSYQSAIVENLPDGQKLIVQPWS